MQARVKHAEYRTRLIAENADPLAERRAAKQVRAGKPTFEGAAAMIRVAITTEAFEGHRRHHAVVTRVTRVTPNFLYYFSDRRCSLWAVVCAVTVELYTPLPCHPVLPAISG